MKDLGNAKCLIPFEFEGIKRLKIPAFMLDEIRL